MESTQEHMLQYKKLLKEEVRLSQLLGEARDLFHSLERQLGMVIGKKRVIEKLICPVTTIPTGKSGIVKEKSPDVLKLVESMSHDQLLELLVKLGGSK